MLVKTFQYTSKQCWWHHLLISPKTRATHSILGGNCKQKRNVIRTTLAGTSHENTITSTSTFYTLKYYVGVKEKLTCEKRTAPLISCELNS